MFRTSFFRCLQGLACLGGLCCAPPASAWQKSPPDVPSTEEVRAAVDETRGLLDGGLVRPARPWYDARTDGVRRFDVRAPQQRQTRSWGMSGMSGFFRFLQELGGWLGVGLIGALIALIAWRVVVYLRDQRGEDADDALALDARRSDVDRVEALPFQVARQTSDLLGEARRLYELGRYGEAIVYLFSHELVELDKQQIIHLAHGKTNRQLVREIGPRRELRQLVEQTMVAFEDVFFGNHSLSRARFEACWLQLDRFTRLAQEVVA